MSENLMDSVAPALSPPVTRQPAGAAAEPADGAELAIVTVGPVTISFAADEDE
ncbi:hypothetical protein ACFXPA_25800 [Amycolatopsis sp. NPDC059090]|uniref:hypothetical protein n=1 Tax=unclassified Amycolatopsis TaxID=2618356 RepID=UPI00366C7D9C